MVQINLLPVTAKKKRQTKAELRIKVGPLIFALVGVILVVVVCWTILGIRLSGQRKQLTQRQEQLGTLRSSLKDLDQQNQDKKQFQRRLEFLEAELKREVFWAESLNRLSNLVPPGIWFKKISLQTTKEKLLKKYVSLRIDGSVISLRGEEMIDLIGEFMNALKKDELFSEQFSEIKLLSSKRSKSGKFEIMDFSLHCQFR